MIASGSTIRDTLALFHSDGTTFELRAMKGGEVRSGFYQEIEKAAGDARELDETWQPDRIGFTINPVNDALHARCMDRIKRADKGSATSDQDILRRLWLFVDIDPERPSGVSSNDEELNAAIGAAADLVDSMRGYGWFEPIMARSGNGVHLLYRIDLPNDEMSKLLVKRVLAAMAQIAKVNQDGRGPQVKVDLETYKAAGMPRLYGCMARKGDDSPKRPWRKAEIYHVPEDILVIPLEKLEALAALAPQGRTANGHAGAGYTNGHGRQDSRLMVDRWLMARGHEFTTGQTGDGRTSYEIPICPLCQKPNKAAVMQDASGKLSVKCMSAGCETNAADSAWAVFRDAIGKPDPDHYDPPHRPKPEKAPRTLLGHTKIFHKDSGEAGSVVEDRGDYCVVRYEGQTVNSEVPKSRLVLADGAEANPALEPYRVEVISHEIFVRKSYTQRFLIKRVLVAGQPCVIGGPQKCLKTSIALDLAYSLGTATKFLGIFDVPEAVAVAVLSGESGGFTLQRNLREIAYARNMLLTSAPAKIFWGFKLPQVSKPDHLAALGDMIMENEIKVAIIDPAYLFLLSGSQGQASNIFDMGTVLQGLTELGQETGCTFIIIHHFRKSPNPLDRFSAPVLEDLSMSGFAEWARQWLLLNRREKYEPGTGVHELWMAAGGSAGHGGTWSLQVDEGVMDDDFGGRKWAVKVESGSEFVQGAQQRKEQAKADKASRESLERRDKVVEALQESAAGLTKRKIREHTKLNNDYIIEALNVLIEDQVVVECEVSDESNRKYAGYQINPEPRNPFGFTPMRTA